MIFIKRSLSLITTLLLFTQIINAQLPKFLAPNGDAGYMGLFDMGFSVGYSHFKEHRTYPGDIWQDGKTNTCFIMGHFQESVLSNYFWSTESDKKFKIGITETLDLGVSYLSNKKTTNGYSTNLNQGKGFGFIFSYEAGLGGVYKINNKMDAGFTYYLLSLSTFNKPDHHHSAKFRFRYSHVMAEVSTISKTSIDIKYLKGQKTSGTQDKSSSSYIGLTYTGWKAADGQWNNHKIHAGFYYLSIGAIF